MQSAVAPRHQDSDKCLDMIWASLTITKSMLYQKHDQLAVTCCIIGTSQQPEKPDHTGLDPDADDSCHATDRVQHANSISWCVGSTCMAS